jgi:hypothetical protein
MKESPSIIRTAWASSADSPADLPAAAQSIMPTAANIMKTADSEEDMKWKKSDLAAFAYLDHNNKTNH